MNANALIWLVAPRSPPEAAALFRHQPIRRNALA
jgi:hypothetical protein